PDREYPTKALAEERIDIVRANPVRGIMGAGGGDVIVDVVHGDRVAVLVQPGERAGDDEEDLHRLVAVIGDQRVALARRLVDEVALRRRPVMLEIAPFPADRV